MAALRRWEELLPFPLRKIDLANDCPLISTPLAG
jgi:hypothetical protein